MSDGETMHQHADSFTFAGPAVQAIGLSKRYGSFDALVDLHLSIASGQVFGLLGPNGAGKTTFIRTLLGFIFPTSGRALVLGIDPSVHPVAVKRQVAYLPGDARLPREMRGTGVLRFFADMQPEGDFDRSVAVARRLELDLRRFVGFMSTGMRQKLAIAAVMGSRAPLLILDEPTANLDPTVRGNVLEMVDEAREDGRTVILSSHVMSEIEDVCDSVAFLRRGRLVLEQSLESLKQRHRIVGRIGSNHPIEVPARLKSLVESISRDGEHVSIDTMGDLAPLLRWLESLDLRQMRVEAYGLRAVYDAIHRGDELSEVAS
ncbi:MAG: ABC transporter ATP-binding protein [Planctomycetaceae bacterium]